MAITIPNADKVRPTIDYKHIQCVAYADLVPGPVSVRTTQANSAGNCEVIQAVDETGYLGFNVKSVSAGQAPSVLRSTIIEGLAGMTPGSELYCDADDGAMTHTATDNGKPFGIALTATKAYIY